MSVGDEHAFFLISSSELSALERLSKRLFTEECMNGNEMRDAAQVLESIVRVTRQMPESSKR